MFLRSLMFLLLTLLPACAHYPVNKPLAAFDPHAGYRFENLPPSETNTDDLFVIVAFSGGGMRSTAFSYGVLEALNAISLPAGNNPRTLLDEVDVITSVSSSSLTAAYYALHGKETFATFPKRVLYRDFQAILAAEVLHPVNWPRLGSPQFSRSDLLADVFDRELFHGLTYADLIRRRLRPYVLLNAADISTAAWFEFSQEQFDFLYSDLASVPLSRAVAASMAYPVFLEPMVVENYPHAADFHEPAWVSAALQGSGGSARVARRAASLRSYEDAATRRHIRVLDGAYGDYLGLQGPLISFLSPEGEFSLRRMIDRGKIKQLVLISVNAARTPNTGWDNRDQGPGWYDMLYFGLTAPIRNNSWETATLFQELLQADHARADAPAYESYFVNLDFGSVKDAALRQRLEDIPTSLALRQGEVDALRRGAGEALRDSPEFGRLLKTLR